jgi:hypothetical protein
MRLRFAFALALVALAPLAGAALVGACGGAAFTSAPDEGALGPPVTDAPSTSASFCALEAGTHTFCDDFDGPPLTSKWDSIDQGGNGTAVTDDTESDSPPDSFKSIAPSSVNGETRGRVVKAFGTASHVVVAFEIALDATPDKVPLGTIGGDSVVGIYVGPNYSIGISAHTGEVGFFEDVIPDSGLTQVLTSKDFTTPAVSGWTEVVLAIDLAHATVSVTIGGVQALNGAPITPPSGQEITVYLGAFSRNQGQSLAAHYDNVTIDVTP